MEVFNIVRGSYKAINLSGKIKDSVVKITGIDLPAGKGALVSNFRVADAEKLGIIQCFNNANHIYAFGHDPEASGFSVTYIVFLGSACPDKGKFSLGNSLSDLVSKYKFLRVSESNATVQVTLGGDVSCKGILCTLDVSVFDSEINALTVTLAGKVLEF